MRILYHFSLPPSFLLFLCIFYMGKRSRCWISNNVIGWHFHMDLGFLSVLYDLSDSERRFLELFWRLRVVSFYATNILTFLHVYWVGVQFQMFHKYTVDRFFQEKHVCWIFLPKSTYKDPFPPQNIKKVKAGFWKIIDPWSILHFLFCKATHRIWSRL